MTATEPNQLLKARIARALRGPVLRSAVIPPLRSYFRYFPMKAGKAAIWGAVASHLWWLESRIRATTRFGSTLEVDARDGCGRFIYYFGLWEPNLTALIKARLKPGDCFVDVGSNVGYFTLLGSQLVGPAGKVVSIEAVPRTFGLLAANIAANPAENVRPLNVAVWDKEEQLTLFVSPDVIDCTSTAIPSLAEGRGLREKCNVAAAPLSSLLTPDEVAAARLIKIDVEGAERQAIAGFGRVLERGRKDLEIVIEIAIEAFDDVTRFFREQGFFCYHVENDYSVKGYINGIEHKGPVRLEAAPSGHTYLDLIFSRINAAALA